MGLYLGAMSKRSLTALTLQPAAPRRCSSFSQSRRLSKSSMADKPSSSSSSSSSGPLCPSAASPSHAASSRACAMALATCEGSQGWGVSPPGTVGYPRVRIQHSSASLAYPERLRSQPVPGEVEVEQAEIPTEDSEFLGDELEGGGGCQHLGLGEAAGWGRGMRLSGPAETCPTHYMGLRAETCPAHPSCPWMSPLPATSLWMQGRATSSSAWRRPREPGACGRLGRAGNCPRVSLQSREGWWGWIWTQLSLLPCPPLCPAVRSSQGEHGGFRSQQTGMELGWESGMRWGWAEPRVGVRWDGFGMGSGRGGMGSG